MIPTKFPEANVTFAENQPEYLPLPAFVSPEPSGEVITCWKLTFLERLQILFFGRLWLSMLAFHQPLTPVFLTVNKNEVLTTDNAKA